LRLKNEIFAENRPVPPRCRTLRKYHELNHLPKHTSSNPRQNIEKRSVRADFFQRSDYNQVSEIHKKIYTSQMRVKNKKQIEETSELWVSCFHALFQVFSMEGCLNVPLHHLQQSFLIDSLFRAFHTSDMESILCDCAFVSFHVMFFSLSLFFFHFMSPSLNPVSQVCATAEHLAIETAAHVLHTSMTLQLQVTSMFVYMRHTNMWHYVADSSLVLDGVSLTLDLVSRARWIR